MNTRSTDLEPVGELLTLFAAHPRLTLRWGTQEVLKRFRAGEPGLVSSARATTDVKIVLLEYAGTPLGVASFFLEKNTRRATGDNLFARVDLVIVSESQRDRGVARAVCVDLSSRRARRSSLQHQLSCRARRDSEDSL